MEEKALLKKTKITASILALALVVLCLPNMVVNETSGQAQNNPVFTYADREIPGFDFEVNCTGIWAMTPQTNYANYTLFNVHYERESYVNSVKASADMYLSIIYFYDAAKARGNANERYSFDDYKSHIDSYEESVQPHPEAYIIIENEDSINYRSLVSAENRSYTMSTDPIPFSYNVKIVISGADPAYSGNSHYIIYIEGYGSGFSSGYEVQQKASTLVQHAVSLINQKSSSSSSPTSGPTSQTSPTSSPSPSPTPSASPTQGTAEEFEVRWFEGTVKVQRAGSSDWIPAATGMVLHEGDAISNPGRPF